MFKHLQVSWFIVLQLLLSFCSLWFLLFFPPCITSITNYCFIQLIFDVLPYFFHSVISLSNPCVYAIRLSVLHEQKKILIFVIWTAFTDLQSTFVFQQNCTENYVEWIVFFSSYFLVCIDSSTLWRQVKSFSNAWHSTFFITKRRTTQRRQRACKKLFYEHRRQWYAWR